MVENQSITRLARLASLSLLILSCGIFQASPTPQPPGKISGKVIYQDLKKPGSHEPLPGVRVALCRISAAGLPKGPPVASGSQGEQICILQAAPAVLTDADGAFVLDGVPPGAYLVLFHPSPDEIEAQGLKWDGVVLTEAPFNEVKSVVPPVQGSSFWEQGGKFIGESLWSIETGLRLSKGNVCSNKYKFCFSIRDERLYPVVTVEPNGMVEIELTAHFKSKQ
jgi:hypothetical protein